MDTLELQVVRMLEDLGLRVRRVDSARQEMVVSYAIEDRDAE